jgi:acetoacetate decarboxylase
VTTISSAAYTMPDVSPLYPPLPYRYRGYRKLSVFATAGSDALRSMVPAPLVLAGDVFEAFVMEAPDVDGLRPYSEAGIVIPVRHGQRLGGHVAFEYVTTDDALTAGREIWGYPKKIADVALSGQGDQLSGQCVREGTTLIEITFSPRQEAFDTPVLHPRLQVKRIPSPADEPTRGQVVWNELLDVTTTSLLRGTATLSLGDSLRDNLSQLGPGHIIGAQVLVGDFLLGHGSVIDHI